MDINAQTILELRAALAREVTESQVRAERDSAQLNEISRINKELVNTQRELASVAESARQDVEKVKFSETRYRRLFESAKDGILILDAKTGKIEDVNPYLCQLLGYTPDDFIGKQLWEIGTFRDIAANQDAFHILQEQEYVRYDDLPLETKDGESISVEFVSNVYICADKAVIQCNIRDIRERKAASADSARLAAIVEASSDAIISKTLDGIITSWNAGAQKLYGYTAQEAIGRPVSFLAPPNLPNEMPELLEKVKRDEPVEHYETVRLHKDGSRFDISLSISPIRDSQGKIIGASSIKRDITERKQAEEALHRHQAELRVLFDLIPAMLWFKDTENGILRVNRRVAEAAGKSVEEIEGKSTVEIYPEDAAKFYADDLGVIRSGAPKLGFVETLRDGEGKKLWVQTDKVPVCDEAGKVIGIVVMAQDVTEQKQAGENLQRQAQELASSNDELARFNRLAVGRELRMVEIKQQINRLSHQLGTPPPYQLAFLSEAGLLEEGHATVGSGDNDYS